MSEPTNPNKGWFEPAVVMSILTIVVSGATTYGGLTARVTANEEAVRKLDAVPERLAAIEALLRREEAERHAQ